MTAIDKALRLAQESKERTMDFYRLFIRSEFLVPIMDTPGLSKAHGTATKGTFKFRIKLLQKRRILMAFDTPKRLQDAIKKPTQYVTLGGRALVSGLGRDLYLMLNAGTPFAKMFLPKELAWLKDVFSKKPVKRA